MQGEESPAFIDEVKTLGCRTVAGPDLRRGAVGTLGASEVQAQTTLRVYQLDHTSLRGLAGLAGLAGLIVSEASP